MGSGLRVEIVNREDGSAVLERTFHDFPIRIGRDPLAEISLPYPFITRWHAVLEVEDGAVLLRDIGSTNGTAVGSPLAKLPPHETVDLTRYGNAFILGPLHVSTEITHQARPVEDRGGPMLSSVAGRTSPHDTARNHGAVDYAVSSEARVLANDIRAAYDASRVAWNRLYQLLDERLHSLKPATRAQVVRLLVNDFPALLGEPDFQRLTASLGLSSAELRNPSALRDEDVALAVLKELAESYRVPHVLSGREAIVGFARKLQDVLNETFRGYVTMRDGLRQFGTEFEVKQGKAKSSHPAAQVQSPADLSARVLDWTDEAPSGRIFRSLFVDLMIHNMSMIDGVMKGAGALLQQLAPTAIVEAFVEAKRDGRAGFSLGVFRYRELWKTFETRHRDVAREEGQTYRHLFGREFALSYEQLFVNAAEQSAADSESMRNRPPLATTASASPLSKTPETHGMPKPTVGPTGTVVVPRISAPQPNAGPMDRSHAARVRGESSNS